MWRSEMLLDTLYRGLLMTKWTGKRAYRHNIVIASAGGIRKDQDGKSKKDHLNKLANKYKLKGRDELNGYLFMVFAYDVSLIHELEKYDILYEDVLKSIFQNFIDDHYNDVQLQVRGEIPPKETLKQLLTTEFIMKFINSEFSDQGDAIYYLLLRGKMYHSHYEIKQELGTDPRFQMPVSAPVALRTVVQYPSDDFILHHLEEAI